MPITLMRGRFQPFAKGHYEAIRSYYLNIKPKSQKKGILPDKLILLLVRDHDSVRMDTPLKTDTFFRGNEDLSDFFRHLDFFNPLSAYQALERIQHSIDCFTANDPLVKTDTDYQKFINNIGVVICPLKFPELVGALEKQDFVPWHMERYVNHITDRIEEDVVKIYINDLKDDIINALRKAYKESKQDLINQVFTTWARFTRDMLPPFKDEVYWVFPIFDSEDWDDYKKIRETSFAARTYFLSMGDEYVNESGIQFFAKKKVGLYGLFIEYVLFCLEKNSIIGNGVIHDEMEINELIDERFKKIEKILCCPDSIKSYHNAITAKVMKASNVLSLLTSDEISEYFRKKITWNEDYVKAIRKSVLDTPYLIVIALINQLAHDKFKSVVDKVTFLSLEDADLTSEKEKQLEFFPLKPSYADQLIIQLEEMLRGLKRKETPEEEALTRRIRLLSKQVQDESMDEKILKNTKFKELFDNLILHLKSMRVEDIAQTLEKISMSLQKDSPKKESYFKKLFKTK